MKILTQYMYSKAFIVVDFISTAYYLPIGVFDEKYVFAFVDLIQ
jgi:hypothetical protein